MPASFFQPAAFTTWDLHLSPLSPLHLGTGQDYGPSEYFLRDGVLHAFNLSLLAQRGAAPPGWLVKLGEAALELRPGPPASELLLRIRKEIADHQAELLPLTTRLALADGDFARLFAERANAPAPGPGGYRGGDRLNQLAVQRTAADAEDNPYIPGSAIKGAIRTAVLNALNGGPPGPSASGDLQNRLLGGGFQSDPFRLLAVSDATEKQKLGLDLRIASNRKRQAPPPEGKEAEGPPQYLECIPAFAFRAFAAELRWQQRPQSPAPPRGFPAAPADLARGCNDFFLPKFDEEAKRFGRAGAAINPAWLRAARACLTEAEKRMQAGEAFLLRIGRHSGALAVTLDGARRIKILKDGNRPEPTTTWFAQDAGSLLPMGWVLAEITPAGEKPPAWKEFCGLAGDQHAPRSKKLNKAWDEVTKTRNRVIAGRARAAAAGGVR